MKLVKIVVNQPAKMMSTRADHLIQVLELLPHPEGGFYREVYRSKTVLQTDRGERSALTTILFLLRQGDMSVFHRVSSDEVWHFLEGDPLRLISLSPEMDECAEYCLADMSETTLPVVAVERDRWQAAESLGEYSLVGCTVGPGFDFEDFFLMKGSTPIMKELKQRYPSLGKFVGID